jgi:hypothetical protein
MDRATRLGAHAIHQLLKALLETKGQETAEVERKDEAARRWCEDATALSGTQWRCMKLPQKHFEQLQPAALTELVLTTAELDAG